MNRKFYSAEEVEYMRKSYHNTDTQELAQKLGVSIGAARRLAHRLGLKKDKQFLQQAKRCEEMLCLKCKNATNKPCKIITENGKKRLAGKCSWADRLEPVKGWEIEYTGERTGYQKSVNGKSKYDTVKKFKIIYCPLFEAD